MEPEKPLAPVAATPGGTKLKAASPSPSAEKALSFSATTAAGKPLSARQIEILEGRGINVELAVNLGWRSTMQPGTGEAIAIPYFRNGQEVNCKTRTIAGEKKFHQVKDAEKCLYNVDAIKDLGHSPLVITEGEMDCIIALQCGFIAVSVPDGAPKDAVGDRPDSLKYSYLADIPENIEKIIIASDSDNPGLNLRHDLAIRLGKHRCLWVSYPAGCKDLNDVFKAHGESGVKECLNGAQFMKIEGLWKLSEMPPLPVHPAMDVGIDLLHPHFRLRLGDFSVFTGIPSHGKTTLANQIAFNMAYTHGWHVCFASFEQHPQTEHRRSLRGLYAEKPEWEQDAEEIRRADNFIDENFSFIVPSDNLNECSDLTWLKDLMIGAIKRFNAKLIIIDPWNELDHNYNSREETITQYVGRSIKELKRFAQKYLIHLMVVAHPAKMQKKNDGTYPVPTAYDISDSAHWYNKPEQIVIVHRVEEDKTMIRIAKSRYHQILGKPGDIELRYNQRNYQYEKPENNGYYGG